MKLILFEIILEKFKEGELVIGNRILVEKENLFFAI